MSTSVLQRDSVHEGLGYVLAVSYPLLAFSAAGRAVYQIFFKSGLSLATGPLTSAFAALCYLLAALGFAYHRAWTWWLSLTVLLLESTGTLVVGALSVAAPDVIGSSVWRWFGIDFAFFPLVQPLLGLAWLTWPKTRRKFGVRAWPWLPRRAASGPAA